MTYLCGVGLKTILYLISNTQRPHANKNFVEIALWPIYLVFDIFMFTLSLFEKE